MSLHTVRMAGELLMAAVYLVSPLLIWWGARYATRIPGWRKLSVLLIIAGIERLLAVADLHHPSPQLMAVWDVLCACIGVTVTILLWRVISMRTARFMDLPEVAAADYIDKVPFPACVVDEYGGFLVINARYSEVMGVTMPEIKNRNWLDYVVEEDRARVLTTWMDFFEARCREFNQEFRWRHPDKGQIRVRGIGHINGQCVFCSIQDVTAQDSITMLKSNLLESV